MLSRTMQERKSKIANTGKILEKGIVRSLGTQEGKWRYRRA